MRQATPDFITIKIDLKLLQNKSANTFGIYIIFYIFALSSLIINI